MTKVLELGNLKLVTGDDPVDNDENTVMMRIKDNGAITTSPIGGVDEKGSLNFITDPPDSLGWNVTVLTKTWTSTGSVETVDLSSYGDHKAALLRATITWSATDASNGAPIAIYPKDCNEGIGEIYPVVTSSCKLPIFITQQLKDNSFSVYCEEAESSITVKVFLMGFLD